MDNFYSAREQDITKFATDPEIIKLVRDNNWYALNQYLALYLVNSKNYYEGTFIFTLDSDYTIVANSSSKGEGIGLKAKDVPSVKKNIEYILEGKTHFSELLISPITFHPNILITAPIKDNGKVIAGVGFAFMVGDFATEIIKKINIGSNGYPFFLTKNLTVIAHKDEKQIMKNKNDDPYSDFLKDSDIEKSFLYSEDGIIRSIRKQVSAKYDFIVATTIVQEDLERPALASTRDITIIAFITLFATGFFLYHLLNLKLHPLAESSRVLAEMEKGNMTERVNILSMDEIGSIQRSLYSFADRLSSIIHNDIQIANNLAAASDEMHLALDNLSGNAQILRNQFNETSKTFSAFYLVPDLNHHLMEGLQFPQPTNLQFILLNSNHYSEKIQKRMRLTSDVIKQNNQEVVTEDFVAWSSKFGDFLMALSYGCYLTLYMGLLYEQNPAVNPWVDWFKNELAND
jgi:hypothetical protein